MLNRVLRTVYSLPKKVIDRAQKVDKFTHTYMRCYQPHDTQTLIRKNHIGKFVMSLVMVPIPAIISVCFPYQIFYSEFFEIPFIYELPGYVGIFLASREFLGNITFRHQLKFKQRLYEKYKPEMDFTKERIEELEYEESRMRLEAAKQSGDNDINEKKNTANEDTQAKAKKK